jgi:adenosylcobinamide kinase/adenosylcobinamide-phosphate guanylyltransferase
MKALITGGVRSGKTRRALELTASLGEKRVYLATAEAWDGEMSARIQRHKAERDESWRTIEEPLNISPLLHQPGCVVLVDCLTLWMSNLLHAHKEEEAVHTHVAALVQAMVSAPNPVVFVTNEVGFGIVPMNALARRFRDHAGWLAQAVAAQADRVELCCAGLQIRMKG